MVTMVKVRSNILEMVYKIHCMTQETDFMLLSKVTSQTYVKDCYMQVKDDIYPNLCICKISVCVMSSLSVPKGEEQVRPYIHIPLAWQCTSHGSGQSVKWYQGHKTHVTFGFKFRRHYRTSERCQTTPNLMLKSSPNQGGLLISKLSPRSLRIQGR